MQSFFSTGESFQNIFHIEPLWMTDSVLFHPSLNIKTSLREKCSYLEFFWSEFSRISNEYGDLLVFSPNAANTD